MDSDKKNDVSGGAIFSGNSENTDTASGVISNGATTDTQQAGLRHSFSAHRPTKVITSTSGDIILNASQKPKKSKVPIIIICVLIVVAAISTLIFALQQKVTVQELRQAFSDYQSALVRGNAELVGELTDSQQPLVTHIFDRLADNYVELDEDAYGQYIASKHDAFLLLYQQTNTDSNISELVATNTELVDVLIQYLRSSTIRQQLEEKFLSDGSTAALELASSKAAPSAVLANLSLPKTVEAMLYAAYELEIENLGYYQEAGCYEDDTLNDYCLSELSYANDTVSANNQRISAIFHSLRQRYLPAISGELMNNVNAISAALEEL